VILLGSIVEVEPDELEYVEAVGVHEPENANVALKGYDW